MNRIRGDIGDIGTGGLLILLLLVIALYFIIAIVMFPNVTPNTTPQPMYPASLTTREATTLFWNGLPKIQYPRTTASRSQEIYLSALEWCESRARCNVNPADNDGTPSYCYFQWKLATFRQYVERYGMAEDMKLQDGEYLALMADEAFSREILRRMLLDRKVRWDKEFPGCVKLIGAPPQY